MVNPVRLRSVMTSRSRPATVPEQISAEVNAAIMRGEYLPGDPVREQELADAFSVSRGPIREALRMLEKTGVVTIVPLKGAHVTRISKEELSQFFEIRCVLIPLISSYLLKSMAETIGQLEGYVDRMFLLAEEDSDSAWSAYVQAVYDINREMCDGCQNPQLANIWMTIVDQTARYTRLGLRSPARRSSSSKGWKKFVRALRNKQVDTAAEVLFELIDASRQAAIRTMEQDQV